MIFYLYAVVSNFTVKILHNLIGSFFWWLFFISFLTSIVTFIGQIIVAQQWVWQVLFCVFPALFIFITFFPLGFSILAVIRRIRFTQYWVWWWWFWLRVLWYVHFYLDFWLICWSCYWLRVWCFFFTRDQVQMWHCYVYHVCTNRIRFQRWLNHRKKIALKFLIFPPTFKISFIAIFIICSL